MRKLLIVLLILTSACSNAEMLPTNGAVSVMAYNVLYDSKKIDASIDLIAKHDPALLCLRELTPQFQQKLLQRIGKRYPYRKLHPRKGTWGAGILSKYEIKQSEYFPLKPHRIPGLEARISIKNRTLILSCLHLFPPLGKHRKNDGFFTTLDKNQKLRKDQVGELIKRYQRNDKPIIILGDMNEDREDGALTALRKAGYQHSCEVVETDYCGGTFPAGINFVPAMFEIDHILGKGVGFISSEVVRSGGSDHYPVKAVFLFK